MPSSLRLTYGSADQSMTLTLTSLASSATAARESTVVDNATTRALDVLVTVKTKVDTGTIGNDRAIYIYAYGTTGGTTYPDTVTGSDANLTLTDPTPLKLIGRIVTPTDNTVYITEPMSIASAFDGVMPQKWGVVVRNYTGVALSGTGGDHAVLYQAINAESV